MTSFNNRLDEVLASHGAEEGEFTESLKQAITSLIKELVAEAKPYRETIIDKWNKDRVDEVKATNAAMNAWADIYEQNLLKALEGYDTYRTRQ